jgi:hypothetical protein
LSEGEKKMKKIVYAIIFTVFMFCLCFSTKAQMQPGMIDMTSSINTSIDNYNNMEALRRYRNGSSGSSIVREREAIGQKRIKAGKATMSFTPTQAGLQRYVKDLKFDANEPQTLPEQLSFINDYVKRFNTLLTKAGYKVNDSADAYAFGYVIAYEAYYDKKPNASDVQKLRQSYRQKSMNEAYFQGMPDADKQYNYTHWANMSLQAIDWRERSRQAKTYQERRQADERAKHYAKYIVVPK